MTFAQNGWSNRQSAGRTNDPTNQIVNQNHRLSYSNERKEKPTEQIDHRRRRGRPRKWKRTNGAKWRKRWFGHWVDIGGVEHLHTHTRPLQTHTEAEKERGKQKNKEFETKEQQKQIMTDKINHENAGTQTAKSSNLPNRGKKRVGRKTAATQSSLEGRQRSVETISFHILCRTKRHAHRNARKTDQHWQFEGKTPSQTGEVDPSRAAKHGGIRGGRESCWLNYSTSLKSRCCWPGGDLSLSKGVCVRWRVYGWLVVLKQSRQRTKSCCFTTSSSLPYSGGKKRKNKWEQSKTIDEADKWA